MQDRRRWSPPAGPLGRLTVAAADRAAALNRRIEALRALAADQPPAPSFSLALAAGEAVAVIAELKRRSPSKGSLNEGMSAVERGGAYVAAGARALSVLTEPVEFGGDVADLAALRRAVSVPLLKKDFHVAPSQVWEARALGASAMLFIARALEPEALQELVALARETGVEPLVEVRSEDELGLALRASATLIGVNARDLETLVIDPAVPARLIPTIPATCVRVAESGMATPHDVACAAAYGADAVLIGSALSTAPAPDALLRALVAVPRMRRAAGADVLRAAGRAGG